MRFSRRRDSPSDGGMATAELAACLPVLVLVLAVFLSAVSVASARVRAQDAAREAARVAARATARAGPAAPRDGQIRLSITSTTVVATVTRHVHLLVPFMPAVTVREQAVAAREPP